MEQGKFFVFEGQNGCGKGEQITRFQHYLRSLGKAVPVFLTGEPNETFDRVWGKRAREILKSDGDPYENNVEALECFSKNREVHNSVFVPLLDRGSYVISDRYYHSTFVFQNAQGLSFDLIAEKNRKFRIPDLTFLIDVPVEVALERRKKRGENLRKFERDLGFDEKVRNNYLSLPKILPALIRDYSLVVINGDQSPEAVFKDVVKAYENKFG